MFNFKISPQEFEYLSIQKGNLSDHLYDRHFWQVEYDKDIENTLRNISEFFPDYLDSVLDIGSGLGGINAAIKHDVNRDIHVGILDGFDCQPEVTKHNIPFSNVAVADSFLRSNGIKNISYYGPIAVSCNRKYDLILSLQAYCFHFPPSEYMNFMLSAIQPSRTVVILDVRNEKPEWVKELVDNLGPFEVIYKKPKYSRMVFRP